MSCAATLSAAKDSTNAAASGASAATSVGVVVSGGSTVTAGVGNGGSGGGGAGGVAANSAAAVARRFSMEGVGARVIRGPDWKWNKQVINTKTFAHKINVQELVHQLSQIELNMRPRVRVSNRKQYVL